MNEEAIYEARLELVDFLIEVFWDEPDEAFLETLLTGDVVVPEDPVNESLDEGFDLLREFIDEHRDRPVEAVHQAVGEEYTRVFVGPRPPVLAHETYYRDDTDYIGKGLATVEASYAAAGWSPPDDYGAENDFIAVELAFLRNLITRQLEGEREAFGYERVFIEEHLREWIDAFVAAVPEATDNGLFRAAAAILEGFVEFEEELVVQMA